MTVRYKLARDMHDGSRQILFCESPSADSPRFPIPYSFSPHDIVFVDILEVKEYWAKLKLYYPNGDIIEGWTWLWIAMRPVELHNVEELYDGRFNLEKEK